MKPTLAAILGRFNGDRKQAIAYCRLIARTYPNLRSEYTGSRKALVHQAVTP